MNGKNDVLGTVSRALRVLEFIAERGELAPRAVAAGLDINISTVYHILNTLAAEAYVVRDERAGTYGLGHKVAALNDAFVRRLDTAAPLREILGDLAARTGECAYLAIRRGNEVLIADFVESTRHVRVQSLYPGYSADLNARALGKAVLAHCDEAFVRAHFAAAPPRALTPRSQTRLDDILAELARVRHRGFGEDLEEFREGVCCVAAPFFGPAGSVAGALSVALPAFRYGSARRAARGAVMEAARAATAALAPATRRHSIG